MEQALVVAHAVTDDKNAPAGPCDKIALAGKTLPPGSHRRIQAMPGPGGHQHTDCDTHMRQVPVEPTSATVHVHSTHSCVCWRASLPAGGGRLAPELALERVPSAHSRWPCQQGTALCCSCIQGCPCLSALHTVRGSPLIKHGICIQRPAHGDIHVHPKCCHDVGLMQRGGPPHTTPCGFRQYHGCIAAPTGRQCTAGHNVEPG
jgi:hypothetical protein